MVFPAPGGRGEDEQQAGLESSGFVHSTFCTCSRMRSTSAFIETTRAEISACWLLEPVVFTSRCISWTRKSMRRPAGSGLAIRSAELLEVGREPGHLLGDVRALGEQGHFLRQALRIHRDAPRELRDALGEPLLVVLDRLGRERRRPPGSSPR